MNTIVLPIRARYRKAKVRELADRLGGSVAWAVRVVVPERHRVENATKDAAEIVWALERASIPDKSVHYNLDHNRVNDYLLAEYVKRTRDAADDLVETIGTGPRGLHGLGLAKFGEDAIEEIVQACSLEWITPSYCVNDVRSGYDDPQRDIDLARRQKMPLVPILCGQQTRVAGHPLIPQETLDAQMLSAVEKGVRTVLIQCDLEHEDAIAGVLNTVNAVRRADGGQTQ